MLAEMLVAAWLDRTLAPHAARGALAAAIVEEGRIVAVREYGAERDATFRMASLSKVVTAFAITRLASSGRVDLHGDVGYGPVTLHDLLTHTSGIDDAFFGNTVPVSETISLEQHFARRPPRFPRPPGREIVYSNKGMTLAGRILERQTGRSFERAVEDLVLRPLGMKHSTFVQPPPFSVVVSGAEGERLVQAPAGAMVSTASDMARLMLALLSEDPGARLLREEQFPGISYGLFQDHIGGIPGLFHTGRSGHESVLYLVPEKRVGLFLVHTGGIDRDLRRRFVTDFLATFVPAPAHVATSAPQVPSGTYRPLLFPLERIEYAANLGADTRVVSRVSTILVRLPPFALGRTFEFHSGRTADGYILRGRGGRFTISGPLFEPVTFVRLPWYATGRVHLGAAAIGFLVLLTSAVRRRGLALAIVLLVAAAPLAFALAYFPRGAESRPFHVESAIHVALVPLALASLLALGMPFVAWRTRNVHDGMAAACALAMPAFLFYWNLLG